MVPFFYKCSHKVRAVLRDFSFSRNSNGIVFVIFDSFFRHFSLEKNFFPNDYALSSGVLKSFPLVQNISHILSTLS